MCVGKAGQRYQPSARSSSDAARRGGNAQEERKGAGSSLAAELQRRPQGCGARNGPLNFSDVRVDGLMRLGAQLGSVLVAIHVRIITYDLPRNISMGTRLAEASAMPTEDASH